MKNIRNQEIRMQVIATTILGTLTLMLGSSGANAVTVYFNGADRGPADTLQIGGVMISGWMGNGFGPTTSDEVATVFGSGLGDALLGPAAEVNAEYQYLPTAGNYRSPSQMQDEAVTLSVDGSINSVTVQAVFRAYTDSGVLLPDQFPFHIMFEAVAAGGTQSEWLDPSSGNPITLVNTSANGPFSTMTLAAFWDSPADNVFPYSTEDLSEGVNVEYGFTVLSLNYTPIPEPNPIAFVAEPSAISFVALGLTGLLGVCRRR